MYKLYDKNRIVYISILTVIEIYTVRFGIYVHWCKLRAIFMCLKVGNQGCCCFVFFCYCYLLKVDSFLNPTPNIDHDCGTVRTRIRHRRLGSYQKYSSKFVLLVVSRFGELSCLQPAQVVDIIKAVWEAFQPLVKFSSPPAACPRCGHNDTRTTGFH